MNHFFYLLMISCISYFYSCTLNACPSCVGKIKPESPPFFHPDFYQKGKAIERQTKEQYAQSEFKKMFEKGKP